MCFDKISLRREMIEKRIKSANEENGRAICERISALKEFASAKNVMIYMPIKGEVDVRGLLEKSKTFLTPITKGNVIYPALVSENLRKGAFSVPEPLDDTPFLEKIDIVIVPGVAFGRDFNRLGFGKGYYDRFLNGKTALKIGVCHSFQLLDSVPKDAHDVRMDIIITEEETLWNKENTLSG